jgi:hypothetical protein
MPVSPESPVIHNAAPAPSPVLPPPQAAPPPAVTQAEPHPPGFAAAIHILVPVRSWLTNPGWRQGLRPLIIAYGLLRWILTIGYPEEITKALPVLVAALVLLKWRKVDG